MAQTEEFGRVGLVWDEIMPFSARGHLSIGTGYHLTFDVRELMNYDFQKPKFKRHKELKYMANNIKLVYEAETPQK